MDISRYKELKTEGLTKLELNKDGKIELVIERFDSYTKNRLELEREEVEFHLYNLKMYQIQIAKLQAKLDNALELQADIAKVK